MKLLAAFSVLAVIGTGCAGDLGAEGSLPACNARPVDPADFEPVATEKVEGETRSGYRYAYRGLSGEQVAFHYGVTTDSGAGLPRAGRLPLASVGAGQLTGRGSSWTFTWTGQFPCDRMRVVGTGLSKAAFIRVLSVSGVIPLEEEEGEGGEAPGLEGGAGELEEEELEGETEGALPPGGPAIEWVAVYGSGRDAEDLDRTRRELEDAAGGDVVVAPASCWKGLAKVLGIPRDSFVAALVAVTGNELDFRIERVGGAPTFYGQLRSRCD